MNEPNPELMDDENPEWTEETFATAVPFSALPADLKKVLGSPKQIVPDTEAPSKRQPAA
ncbi:MAG: hypothetical protein ACRD3N_04670 [Terracidiphilus sp.]